jgi:hypothetical protein
MLNVSVKTSRLTLLKAKRSFMWKGRVEVMMNKDSDDIRELGLYLLEESRELTALLDTTLLPKAKAVDDHELHAYLCIMADGDGDDRRRSTMSAVRRLSRCDRCAHFFPLLFLFRLNFLPAISKDSTWLAGGGPPHTMPSLQCCLTRTLPIRNESIALNPILRPLIYDCYSYYPMQHHCSSKSCFTK